MMSRKHIHIAALVGLLIGGGLGLAAVWTGDWIRSAVAWKLLLSAGVVGFTSAVTAFVTRGGK